MIVIEGFDATGKSTLARATAEYFDCPLYAIGGPPRNMADMLECIEVCQHRLASLCVQDRITHVSESVYSMLRFADRAIAAMDAIDRIPSSTVFIYCRPAMDVITTAVREEHERKAWDTDAHIESITQNASMLVELYDSVIDVVALRTKIHLYDRTQPDAIANMLKTIEGLVR